MQNGVVTFSLGELIHFYLNDISEAKAMSRAMFAQEYECEWTTTEDQVYEYLDQKNI